MGLPNDAAFKLQAQALMRPACLWPALAILAIPVLCCLLASLIAAISIEAPVMLASLGAGLLAAAIFLLAQQIRPADAGLFGEVLENGLDAAFMCEPREDGSLVVRRANQLAADMAGVEPVALHGTNFSRHWKSAAIDKMLSQAQAGQAQQLEIELPSSQGPARWLHCQCMPLGRGVLVLMRDISRRKAEEKEAYEYHAFMQSLIEYLPVLIFAKSFRQDNYDKMVVWNNTGEHVMGYSAEQVIGKSNHDIFPAKVADTLNALDRQMLAAPKVVTIPEFPYRRPDGSLSYLRSTSLPLFNEQGGVDYILGIVEDITARRAQEWELRSQRAEMAAINDALPVGLFRTDAQGRVVYVNTTFERMMGMSLEQIAHEGWHAALHPDDKSAVLEEWAHALHNDLPYQNTLRFKVGNKVLWASLKAAQVRMDGKVRGYVGSVDDITQRLQAEQDLLKGERWLRTIADNLPALIAYVDKDQIYRFTNVHYEELFHRDGAQVLGSHISEVFGGEYYAFTSSRIAAALQGERVAFERESVDRSGHKHYWRVEYLPDVQDGHVAGFYSMVLDITESKELENRLRTLARIDSLTGLANRAWFNEKLAEAIEKCDTGGLHLGVLFLDIDCFKSFNDNFGHHGGDLVLREFSRRLTSCVRHTDTVARLAGDEFVILLIGNSVATETEVVARKIMAEMRREFTLPSGPCRVTTSIGITIRREGETDAEMLLRRADEALYAAKSAGRNGFTTVL